MFLFYETVYEKWKEQLFIIISSNQRMFQKENKPPIKQGVLYQLSLGKDNGPFLIKDIMNNNPKSISMLAGSQIIKSFASLNQSLNFSQTKQKEYTSSYAYIESYSAVIHKIEQDIDVYIKTDSKLKTDEIKLRIQMQTLNETIAQNCSQLVENYAPLLRGLHKVIKEQATMQKEDAFRMQRELREISETKKQLLAGVIKCQQKIVAIENVFGELKKQQRSTKQNYYFSSDSDKSRRCEQTAAQETG